MVALAPTCYRFPHASCFIMAIFDLLNGRPRSIPILLKGGLQYSRLLLIKEQMY